MNASIPIEELNRIKEIPMVFILGKGRSGTSLLQNMLDAHPAIIGPPESKFAVLFYPRFSDIKKWKDSDILLFAQSLYMEPLFASLWHVDKEELTSKLLSVKEYANYSLLCKIVYYQLRKEKEKVLLISDKNPQYVLFIDTILRIFPGAKFIHIVREPRDNIYSQIISFNEKNPVFRAYQWVGFNQIIEQKKKSLPERFFQVKYENLVENPEKVMQSMSKFLEIPFSAEMTQNKKPEILEAQLAQSGMEKKGGEIHKELLRPVNTSNIGKWKKGMTEFDRKVTETITSDYATRTYGYEIYPDPDNKIIVSRFQLLKGKCLYHIWQKFTRLRFKNFQFNLLYSKVKRAIKKEKLPLWEYF
jgi:protein-tyrosine sulfotransferase